MATKVALVKCSEPNCGYTVYNDGSQDGGNPFCKHKMQPVGGPPPVQSPNNQERSYGERGFDENVSRSSAGGSRVFLVPDWGELAAFKQMESTLKDTREHHKKFDDDARQLQDTYRECEENLLNEFAKLQQRLKEREDELLVDLKNEFDKRADKIEDFLKQLDQHDRDNIDCNQRCQQRIQDSNPNDLEEKEKRVILNKDECQKSFDNRPLVHDVPIKLRFRFASHDNLMREISRLGQLDGKGHRVEGLPPLPWTVFDAPSEPKATKTGSNSRLLKQQQRNDRNEKNERNDNNGNRRYDQHDMANDDDIKEENDDNRPSRDNQDYSKYIPQIKRGNLKYSKSNDSLSLIYNPREFESEEDEEQQKYEGIKEQQMAFHIQCVTNNINDPNAPPKAGDIDWEQVRPNLDRLIPMPQPDKRGKYILDLSKENFASNSNVYCRIKFECLNDVKFIQDGRLDGQGLGCVLGYGDWKELNPTQYKVGQISQNIDIIPPMDSPKANKPNMEMNNNNNNNEMDELTPPKVRVKAAVSAIGANKPTMKSWTLKQDSNEYTVDALNTLAAKALKIAPNQGQFKITVDTSDGVEIKNDIDVITHIVHGNRQERYNAIISVQQI